jgi:iron complex outermembrane receptor protein
MKKNYTSKRYVLVCAMLMLSIITYAQTGSLSGKISDEKNESLPGASVAIKELTKGTTTDAEGNFRIAGIPNGDYTVVISFIGYQPLQKKVTITGDTQSNFQLLPSSNALNEVVVIGYGTQRKRDLTGSVTSVTAEDFNKGTVASPEQLITGKVAGVSITTNGGAPGAGSTIRIRGGASLNASNDPLIVIDGVPISNSAIAGSPNALSLINPNDIASMNILKDASATAIYGSRASNGVILITTKKGTSGKPVLSFNSQNSIATLPNQVDVLSADQFRTFVNESSTATPQLKALLGTANTNWQDEIYQTATTTDNNLSFSGTTKKVPYRFSLGYLDQEGVLKTGSLNRTSGAINLTPRLLNNRLKVDLSLKGSLSNSRFAEEGAIGSAVTFDPTKPVYDEANTKFGGYYQWMDGARPKQLAPRNPLALLEQRENNGKARRSIGNIQLDYSLPFLPELHANLNLGYDISKGSGTIFVPENAASGFERATDRIDNTIKYSGENNTYEERQDNKLVEFYLNYVKDIKAISGRLDVVAGYAYQDFKTKKFNFPDIAANGAIITTPNFGFDIPQNRLLSYYGRLNYAFKNKYLFTATVRTDGSSRFNPEKRFATFPSVALAWKIKEESFLATSTVVSDLKLRLGYGLTGQQEGIDNYSYVSYYNLSDSKALYQLGDTFYNMYRPGGYYGPRRWEQTATSNIGLDFGLSANRITGSLDYYFKKTEYLLNEINQPAGTNFSNRIVANVGNMENQGLEFAINTEAIKSKSLNWDIGFNITYNQNKITRLTTAPDPTFVGNAVGGITGGTGQNVQIHSVGAPRSSFNVYQQVYDQAGKPIDGVFVDRNNDGAFNDRDLYRYKSPDPKVFLGLNSTVSYKKWDAGFSARANFGNYAYNNVFSNTGTIRNILNPIGVLNNGSTNVLESGVSGSVNGERSILSDYYVQNASFLRMDNINLGYAVGKLARNTADLRISANVQNAFVITNYKGLDPEIGNGIDNNFYPRPRMFVLGLNLIF